MRQHTSFRCQQKMSKELQGGNQLFQKTTQGFAWEQICYSTVYCSYYLSQLIIFKGLLKIPFQSGYQEKQNLPIKIFLKHKTKSYVWEILLGFELEIDCKCLFESNIPFKIFQSAKINSPKSIPSSDYCVQVSKGKQSRQNLLNMNE